MKLRTQTVLRCLVVSCVFSSPALAAKLQAQTLAAWKQYTSLTEARIAHELDSRDGFLVRDFLPESDAAAIRKVLEAGDIFIKRLKTRNEEGGEIKIPNGLVHHWYGSVLLRGAELDEVLSWVQDYENHQNYFEEVEDSRLVSRQGDVFDIFLRLRRRKVITVHYNTEHQVAYNRHGADAVTSRSESSRIAELDNPGTEHEREKSVENDRGYLWRLNSYWRFQQVPKGVIIECESIGLSRTVPLAIRWIVKPFITAVPRESLEAALQPFRNAFAAP